MLYVNFDLLQDNIERHKLQFRSTGPFRYVIIEGFLAVEKAESILASYPHINSSGWNRTTYINQKKKLQKSTFEQDSNLSSLFKELNGKQMLLFLEELTGIKPLTADYQLFGAGLHQSINGAFLDIHVDFNVHPETKQYRRLNLLVFLNKEWKKEYGGELELWDMEKKVCFERIVPSFNRAVIFETNNKSYHGHPTPLNVPEGVTRKSLAVYYYTEDAPPEVKTGGEHNSIFVSTQGLPGRIKNLLSGLTALKERIVQKFE
jgi:hypothetical protein